MALFKWVYGSDYNEIIADHCRKKRTARGVANMSPLLGMLTACKVSAYALNDENNVEEQVNAEYKDESGAKPPIGAESPSGN